MRALRAIFAVFWAAAGFDAQQRAGLNLALRKILPHHGLCLIHKLWQGKRKEAFNFLQRPICSGMNCHKKAYKRI